MFRRTVEIHSVVRHFTPAFAGKNKHRRYATVDIDPTVAARSAGLGRQRIELLLMLSQVLGKCLEHLAAFMKCVFAEINATDRAGVVENVLEVQTVAGDSGDRLAVDRTRERIALTVTVYPSIEYQVAEFRFHTKFNQI